MAASKEGIARAKRVAKGSMAFLQEKPALSEQSIMENSLFAARTDNECLELWDALRIFYANGFIPDDSPLKEYQQKYLSRNEPGLGLVVMEQDLLRVMAVRYAEVLRAKAAG